MLRPHSICFFFSNGIAPTLFWGSYSESVFVLSGLACPKKNPKPVRKVSIAAASSGRLTVFLSFWALFSESSPFVKFYLFDLKVPCLRDTQSIRPFSWFPEFILN